MSEGERSIARCITDNCRSGRKTSTELKLPRENGGRGLRAVELEYKLDKIKAAVKVYQNANSTIERADLTGHQSLIKEAQKYAGELSIALNLASPTPTFFKNKKGEELSIKFKMQLKESQESKLEDKIRHESC